MRILRIYPFLPPRPGGMEKHILRLTEEQRLLGCEVTLAFNQGDATAPDDIRVLPGVELRKIRPQALRDLIFYLGLFLKLAGRRRHFEVVHVHGDWSAFLLGRLLACHVKAKVRVASFHGVAKHRRLYQPALAGYEIVYATGFREVKALASASKRMVHWQHSGIDEVFCVEEECRNSRFDVISVGSFVPVKNFGLVIEIAAALPDVTFLLVGDGPLRTTIEENCHRRGLSNVTFSGHLPPVEVARRLRCARIFLLTSLAEGTPTALLEAMACGLGIVTSRSNDYDDLLKSGRNGYVVAGFKPQDYVLKIRELLNNGCLLDEISRCNQAQAIVYSWPHVGNRITEWMRSGEIAHEK